MKKRIYFFIALLPALFFAVFIIFLRQNNLPKVNNTDSSELLIKHIYSSEKIQNIYTYDSIDKLKKEFIIECRRNPSDYYEYSLTDNDCPCEYIVLLDEEGHRYFVVYDANREILQINKIKDFLSYDAMSEKISRIAESFCWPDYGDWRSEWEEISMYNFPGAMNCTGNLWEMMSFAVKEGTIQVCVRYCYMGGTDNYAEIYSINYLADTDLYSSKGTSNIQDLVSFEFPVLPIDKLSE